MEEMRFAGSDDNDEFDYSIFDEENATLFKTKKKKKRKSPSLYPEEDDMVGDDEDSLIKYIDDYDSLDDDLLIDESYEDEVDAEEDAIEDGEEEEI